jgi:hypothetical protein
MEKEQCEKEPAMPKDVEVANVMQCSICRGIVDKHELVFVCRNCGAMGDFFTGIMTSQSLQNI